MSTNTTQRLYGLGWQCHVACYIPNTHPLADVSTSTQIIINTRHRWHDQISTCSVDIHAKQYVNIILIVARDFSGYDLWRYVNFRVFLFVYCDIKNEIYAKHTIGIIPSRLTSFVNYSYVFRGLDVTTEKLLHLTCKIKIFYMKMNTYFWSILMLVTICGHRQTVSL